MGRKEEDKFGVKGGNDSCNLTRMLEWCSAQIFLGTWQGGQNSGSTTLAQHPNTFQQPISPTPRPSTPSITVLLLAPSTTTMSNDLNVSIHSAPAEADVDVSGALSQPLPTEPVPARSEAMSLLQLQNQLEADISRHVAILASNGVTMQTPLVDAQGFPIANKDLMAIRTARQRVHVLRNDLQALRDRVTKLLELAINGDVIPPSALEESAVGTKKEEWKPFAKVNSVAENSPAQVAGLQQGDHILKFGAVTAENPKGLGALATPGIFVDGASIQLLVRRDGCSESVSLTLVPRSDWGGRGLLGCHLLPL